VLVLVLKAAGSCLVSEPGTLRGLVAEFTVCDRVDGQPVPPESIRGFSSKCVWYQLPLLCKDLSTPQVAGISTAALIRLLL
jgi:hypothetical protein